MRKRHKQNDDELNFWQPASDMFSALLLILMLIILLLGLYLVQIPAHSQLDPEAGDTYAEGSKEQPDYTATPQHTIFFWFPGGQSGEGGEEGTPQPTFTEAGTTPSASPSPTVTPTPDLEGGGAGGGGGGEGGGEGAGEGPGDEPDMGLKSAVYVMVIDGETGRTVKEANVEFELFGLNKALQILNTYYPERISFRYYETTEAGTFYFPEKLSLGVYELHELTEPQGYDAAENVTINLDALYDWSDPLVIEVPVYPSKNIVRVRAMDAETGVGIEGGSFDLIAAENIITADGTLRYRKGQVVGEIICDESGYGESEEVYLGNYLLRQQVIPQYYAGMLEDVEVAVERKSRVLPLINTVALRRTKVHLSLTDELYPTRVIFGALFTVTSNRSFQEPLEIQTDSVGTFTLDALEAGAVYTIHQSASVDNYRVDPVDRLITVDGRGYIGGEAAVDIEMTNRMIRVNIGITDEFSDIQVPNVNLALYDAGGTLIRTWTTTGSVYSFNNLAPGTYYIIKSGDREMRYDVRVLDQAAPQTINLQTSYVMHYIIIGASIAFVLILVLTVVLLIRRRRKKRRKMREQEE